MKRHFSFATAIALAASAISILIPTAARADIVNVARGGTATSNRAVYGGWSMARLVDGDFGNPLHSEANPGVGLAYTVDLGKDFSISQVKVWPRQDGCCPERLSNFRVSIHTDNGAGQLGAEVWGASLYTDGVSNPGAAAGTVVVVDPPSVQVGRWIQIRALGNPVPDYFLQISELQVFATVPPEEVNRALNTAATASQPLYSGAPSSLLVDGSPATYIHGIDTLDPGFAYEINLGAPINLNKIVVWARQDGCCPERLTNYRVAVHQDDNGAAGALVWKADLHADGSNPGSGAGAKDELTAALDPTGTFSGQWIRIVSLEDPVQPYALQIGDVEAYGLSAGVVKLNLTAGPQDVAAGPGTSATFSVTALAAGGDASLITYQWQKEGVPIAGATGATYQTPPLGASDDGKKFRCVVGYPGLPSQTTADATVSLNIAFHAALSANRPSYANWPVAWLVDGNRQGSFHLGDALDPGAAYDVNLGAAYDLKRIVLWARQDGCCPERLTNFRVSIHQDDQGAIGPPVWQVDMFTDGSYPPSAPGSIVEITPDLDPAGQFKGQWIQILSLEDPVQNYALQMNEIEAFGTPLGGVNLVISQQPQDLAVGVGLPATLTVGAAAPGGDPSQITYQWQRDGATIIGATQASYQTPALSAGDDGQKFRCVVGYPGLPSQTTNEVTVRVNLAFGAAASANGPLFGGRSASQLTDGNRTGLGGNILHGDLGLPVGFAYEINLGTEVNLAQIVLWARQDGCCPERLSNYRLSVHTDAQGQIGDPVWTADLHTDGSNPGSTPGSRDEAVAGLNPGGTFKGQWLRIVSLDDPVPDYALQLGEVEVFGTYASANPGLVVVSGPADVATAPGRSVQFSAVGKVVNGDPAQLAYHWQKNGVDIPGSAAPVLVTAPLLESDANAKFRCVLSYPGVPDVATREATVTFVYNYAVGQPASSNRPLWGAFQVGDLVNGNLRDVIHGNTAIEPGFAYEVNFGLEINVESIELYPRQDGCCPERLTNLRVSLLKDNQGQPGDEVWHADLFTDGSNPGATEGTVVALTEDDGAGSFQGARWIRILSLDTPPGDYALQMAELAVYGRPVGGGPTIQIGYIGATLSITFSGGTLESSESLASGSWQAIPGATSPYPVVPGASPRFYRVKP